MKKMKNYLFALLAMVFVFASCNKNSVDDRDAFVGTYDYVTSGEMHFDALFIPGADKFPLNSEGTFKIAKLGDKDSVLISGAFNDRLEPFKAIVKGSKLEFVETEYKAKGTNFEVTLTIDNKTASMLNDAIVWESDANCVGKAYTFEVTGSGHVNMTAQKKALK